MNVSEMFRLDGKCALVTGCTRGIGKAMAVALASAGADIIGVSLSLRAGESDVERQILELGKKFYGYSADFSDRASLYLFIDKLKRDIPHIDILVNNAGSILRKDAENHPDDYWDKILETNLSSQFILSREIGRTMLERGAGKIIFVASLLSFQGGVTVPSYAASKGGIAQLTKALANEWAGRGVNVNAIAPGYVSTDNTAALREDEGRSRQIMARIPAARWGCPGDFAGPVVFLASAASAYMHGSILVVDGGWLGR